MDKILKGLKKSEPKLVAKIQPKVENFTEKLMSSVDAYIDENRVLGNSMVSDGRSEAVSIDEELNKLLLKSKTSVHAAGKRVVEANAAIRNVSLILIVVAIVSGAIFSIMFSRNIARRLQRLMVSMKTIA